MSIIIVFITFNCRNYGSNFNQFGYFLHCFFFSSESVIYIVTNSFLSLLSCAQHINGLSKRLPVNSLLESAESVCRQMGNCHNLPEDLQPLLVRPLLPRPVPGSEAVRRSTNTIVCDPNMRAVPSNS